MSNLDRRTLIQGAAVATLIAAQAAQTAQAAAPTKKSLYVIAELVAKPEKADDLRKLMVAFVDKARTEPGCEHYTLLEVESEPGRFLTFETWADKAALDAHMVTPHIKEIIPKLGDLLGKPFTQTFLKALSV